MIELIDVNKTYKNIIALHNINLFIQENEIFGIIGKSGTGKSTLLRCMNLLERPDCGEVIIDNEDITTCSIRKLSKVRQKIGMIFQHFNLINSKTVHENIAIPMRIQRKKNIEIKEKVEVLLELVELTDKINFYPNQLSGGQKQRVAIARALSCSPKILLSDEATSALDPETTTSILELLQKINQMYGITIVLITHEMEVVKRICHRIALMDAGEIMEISELADIFKKYNQTRSMLYNQLSPKLPTYLRQALTHTVNDRPLLRLFFQDKSATVPFISQISRELNLDINILLANIDHFNNVTCGILVVGLLATKEQLAMFISRCQINNIVVEILGYLSNDAL